MSVPSNRRGRNDSCGRRGLEGSTTSDEWDASCDVLVVGTGAAGLTGAVTAVEEGLDTLVVEKLNRWGGTTAYSGGGAWIPDNFLMEKQGANDSGPGRTPSSPRRGCLRWRCRPPMPRYFRWFAGRGADSNGR